MGYTKIGNEVRAEKKESCGQHSLFPLWVLMRLHMILDTEGVDQEGPAPHEFTSSSRKQLESTLDNPDSTWFHTVTHIHRKARTERCCDTDETEAEDI